METAFQRIRAGGTAATPSNSSPTANSATKTTRAAEMPGSAGVSVGGAAAVTRALVASALAARMRGEGFRGRVVRSDGRTRGFVRACLFALRRAGAGAGAGGGVGRGSGFGGGGFGSGAGAASAGQDTKPITPVASRAAVANTTARVRGGAAPAPRLIAG